jgi:hypothetical protein
MLFRSVDMGKSTSKEFIAGNLGQIHNDLSVIAAKFTITFIFLFLASACDDVKSVAENPNAKNLETGSEGFLGKSVGLWRNEAGIPLVFMLDNDRLILVRADASDTLYRFHQLQLGGAVDEANNSVFLDGTMYPEFGSEHCDKFLEFLEGSAPHPWGERADQNPDFLQSEFDSSANRCRVPAPSSYKVTLRNIAANPLKDFVPGLFFDTGETGSFSFIRRFPDNELKQRLKQHKGLVEKRESYERRFNKAWREFSSEKWVQLKRAELAAAAAAEGEARRQEFERKLKELEASSVTLTPSDMIVPDSLQRPK